MFCTPYCWCLRSTSSRRRLRIRSTNTLRRCSHRKGWARYWRVQSTNKLVTKMEPLFDYYIIILVLNLNNIKKWTIRIGFKRYTIVEASRRARSRNKLSIKPCRQVRRWPLRRRVFISIYKITKMITTTSTTNFKEHTSRKCAARSSIKVLHNIHT